MPSKEVKSPKKAPQASAQQNDDEVEKQKDEITLNSEGKKMYFLFCMILRGESREDGWGELPPSLPPPQKKMYWLFYFFYNITATFLFYLLKNIIKIFGKSDPY